MLVSFIAAYFAASCVFLSIADNLSSSALFWLLTLRTEKRISQTDLAARMQTLNVNIDQQMISKIEKNQRQVTDYELAAYEGIKYLFECGHREVAMIGEFYCRENGNASGSYYGRNYHTPLLINGAKRAFQEFGKVFVPENDFFINRKDALSDSPTYYAELMEKRPEVTAVFCVCDASADGFYTQVLKAGRRVPDDISVMGICRNRIGFSQIDFCAMINPLREIGSLAMKLLDDGGDGKKSHMLPCYFNPGTTVKKLG